MFGAPNKKQKDWREAVRNLGSAISGQHPCEIHHCAGRTAKHNKIDIGHWWIIPLLASEHRGRWGVESWARGRKEREKFLFAWVCGKYRQIHGDLPFGNDVYQAIMEYHR